MNANALLTQLGGIRAQIDGIMIQLESEMNEKKEQPPCDHKNKADMSTMGRIHWICQDCGLEFDSLKNSEILKSKTEE